MYPHTGTDLLLPCHFLLCNNRNGIYKIAQGKYACWLVNNRVCIARYKHKKVIAHIFLGLIGNNWKELNYNSDKVVICSIIIIITISTNLIDHSELNFSIIALENSVIGSLLFSTRTVKWTNHSQGFRNSDQSATIRANRQKWTPLIAITITNDMKTNKVCFNSAAKISSFSLVFINCNYYNELVIEFCACPTLSIIITSD